MKALFSSGLQYAIEHPEWGRLGDVILKNKDHPVIIDLLGDNMHASYSIYEHLIRKGIENGEVDEDIDPVYLSHVLAELNRTTIEYYVNNVKGEFTFERDLMDLAQGYIDMILYGVSRGGRKRND